MAMEMLVNFAPSMREKWSRCVEASTTAMFMLKPMERALASLAATPALAASRARVSIVLVAMMRFAALSLGRGG